MYGFMIQISLLDLSCGANSIYSTCMTPCPASCANLAAPSECDITTCVEGCQCAAGFVMSEGNCVPYTQCGCTFFNRYYQVRRSFRGSFKRTIGGTFRRTFRGTFRRTFKRTFRGSFVGTFRRTFRGTFRGIFRPGLLNFRGQEGKTTKGPQLLLTILFTVFITAVMTCHF